MVSLNKALLSPYFWGGYVGGGRLTSHEMSSNLTNCAMMLFSNLLRENKKKNSARNMLKMLKVEMGKITSREMYRTYSINVCGKYLAKPTYPPALRFRIYLYPNLPSLKREAFFKTQICLVSIHQISRIESD